MAKRAGIDRAGSELLCDCRAGQQALKALALTLLNAGVAWSCD